MECRKKSLQSGGKSDVLHGGGRGRRVPVSVRRGLEDCRGVRRGPGTSGNLNIWMMPGDVRAVNVHRYT